jgi:hypothetical protein
VQLARSVRGHVALEHRRHLADQIAEQGPLVQRLRERAGHVRRDFVEGPDGVRCAAKLESVRTDVTDLMTDGVTWRSVERVRAPVRLMRAERGMFDDESATVTAPAASPRRWPDSHSQTPRAPERAGGQLGGVASGSTCPGSGAPSGGVGAGASAAACLRASLLASLRSLRSRSAFSRLSFANVVFFFALDANGSRFRVV